MLCFMRRNQKWITLVLFSLLQFSIFWLGRLSVQITILERDISPKSLSRDESPLKSPALSTYLIVLIMTKPEEADLRATIRQTWLRLSTKTPKMYKHLFVMGLKGASNLMNQLNSEADKHGDLLLLRNFSESYQKLTEKTLSAISTVVDSFDFKFLLKVDGDSFVRLGALLKSLQDIEDPSLYWGFLDGRAKPFSKGGKWLEEEWRLCDHYLPYQLGGGYVLARSLVEFIAKNRRMLKLYRNEDVSVGAWLSGLQVLYVHDPRFDTEWKSRGCNNEYLITHKKSSAEMRQLFENLSARGVLCFPSEYQLRPSYVYDFSVPPSQCCVRRNGTRIP